MSEKQHLDIRDSINLGIEKINNFDKLYNDFINYLKRKNEDKAKKLLNKIENKENHYYKMYN